MKMVPRKNVLEIYSNLSEIIVSLPQETILMPGVNAAISGELARNGINVMEYFGTAPQSILMVDQKDALRSYQLLQNLTLH
jgi:predicted regulator of amino acid metabolism with ACT domain